MISNFYEFILGISEICTKLSYAIMDSLSLVSSNIDLVGSSVIILGIVFGIYGFVKSLLPI